jgi:hypothetical protein
VLRFRRSVLAALRRSPCALLLALGAAATGPGAPRDLEVAIPPGSPLEWGRSFPGYAPAKKPPRPRTGDVSLRRETSQPALAATDARFASSFSLVRVLTWDLTAHIEWVGAGEDEQERPVTGSAPRVAPPRHGDALYWITLAPLLRLMLHPELVSLHETLAHLVEIGEPTLAVVDAASSEKSLAEPCARLRALIRPDRAMPLVPPGQGTPRERMFARFALEELVREHPYDPEGSFGKRLFLFVEDVEPWVVRYATHPSLELQRAAVTARRTPRTRSCSCARWPRSDARTRRSTPRR